MQERSAINLVHGLQVEEEEEEVEKKEKAQGT
jgi:hypothetical protein